MQRNTKNLVTVRLKSKFGEALRKADELEYRHSAEGKPEAWKKFKATIKVAVFDAISEMTVGGGY